MKRKLWNTISSAFFGITFAYFVWLMWRQFTELVGTGWIVIAVTSGVVVIGLFTGYFSMDKILKKFGVE